MAAMALLFVFAVGCGCLLIARRLLRHGVPLVMPESRLKRRLELHRARTDTRFARRGQALGWALGGAAFMIVALINLAALPFR